MPRRPCLTLLAALAMPALGAACIDRDETAKAIELVMREQAMPDTLPRMVNRTLPFRYPHELYERKAQGQVTLRVFIDSAGRLHPESTSVTETSGYPGFDSAAVKGAEDLRFLPAKRRGRAVPVSILLPVYFRHPDGTPLPGDSILSKPGVRRQ